MAVPIVGAVVTSARRAAHRLVVLALGATMAVWVLADGLAVYTLRTHPGAFAGGRWLAWLASWIWIPGWALTALAGLVFPTGSLPSPVAAGRVGLAVVTVLFVLAAAFATAAPNYARPGSARPGGPARVRPYREADRRLGTGRRRSGGRGLLAPAPAASAGRRQQAADQVVDMGHGDGGRDRASFLVLEALGDGCSGPKTG